MNIRKGNPASAASISAARCLSCMDNLLFTSLYFSANSSKEVRPFIKELTLMERSRFVKALFT